MLAAARSADRPRLFRGLLAPGFAFFALSAVSTAAISSIDFLTGAGPRVNGLLLLCAVAAVSAGVARALWLRAHDAPAYARLATASTESMPL
jgi:hypothetical protein